MGRPRGHKLSAVTRDKIRQAALRRKHSEETKRKISQALVGVSKSEEHRQKISRSLRDLNRKRALRLAELEALYPEHSSFFDEHRQELLVALDDCFSERELSHIRRFIESSELSSSYSTTYITSSFHAVEDAIVSIIDLKALTHRSFEILSALSSPKRI